MTHLAAIILYMTTVFVGRQPVYINHMRPQPEARSVLLGSFFEHAAVDNGLPPKFVMAVAWSESGFSSTRIGAVGELGIMQLNPAMKLGRLYAEQCGKMVSGPCDALNIYLGAVWLSEGLKECGNLLDAVGWYKTGHCLHGPSAAEVFAIWVWMEEQ